MASALTSFNAYIDPRGYGGLILLKWAYPETLPTNWRLYIFKKQGAHVPDAKITEFFAGTLDDEELAQAGIYVYRTLPQKITNTDLKDFVVLNDKAYYYKALIRDLDTPANSTIVSGNATPLTNVKLRVIDPKNIASQALSKTLQAVKNTDDQRPLFEKDVRIFKAHAERQNEDQFFVISYTSGQNIQSTVNNLIAETATNTIRGSIDYAVLQIEWIAMGVGERRDKFTTILKALRPVLEYFIMQIGEGDILGVQTVALGDSDVMYGEPAVPALRGVMNVVVTIEQMIQVLRGDAGTWDEIESNYTAP